MSSEDEPEQLQYKVILLGDGATGKTSIANRFTDDKFAMQYKQTIGLDFFIKRLVLPGDVRACCRSTHFSFLPRAFSLAAADADALCWSVLHR